MRQFIITKQEYPPANKPYRIIETILTSDGPRSRICFGTWATLEEAAEQVALKELHL